MTTALKLGIGTTVGVETLTNNSIPAVVRNTIEKEFKKEGFKALILSCDKWQEKFNELKNSCIEVLGLEIEKATTNKSPDNSKSFFAELKTTTQASPSPSSPQPRSLG